MTDAFAELVMPIFRRGIDLQERLSGGEQRSLDEVKQMTGRWLEEARRRAQGHPGLNRSFELARFGLVAWIDEILTFSDWGRTVDSPNEILEWDLFRTRRRADRFYTDAATAEKNGDLDALEVCLLAVTLGFRGNLRDDDAALADWVNATYNRVSGAGGIPDRPFAEDVPHHDRFAPLRGPTLLLAVSILVSITALITLAAYLFAVHVDYDSKHPGSSVGRVSPRPEVHVGQALQPDRSIPSGWRA
jgi:type VI secretion system protein ImpK